MSPSASYARFYRVFRVLRFSARRRFRDEKDPTSYQTTPDRGNTPWPFYGIKRASSRNPDLVSEDGSHERITESAKGGPDQLIKQSRSCRLRCLHSHAFADFCLAIKYITLTSRINHVVILVRASALFISALSPFINRFKLIF